MDAKCIIGYVITTYNLLLHFFFTVNIKINLVLKFVELRV